MPQSVVAHSTTRNLPGSLLLQIDGIRFSDY